MSKSQPPEILAQTGRCVQAGECWLVGAGPGDPDLLTVGALRSIRAATACVYDALVSDQILALLPPGVIKQHAGKRGGKPSPVQEDISLRLVTLAKSGHAVVRLKGGDPLVFGRGMEEVHALVKADIPTRVIPGITSGLGGLAWAGVPLTHRHTNSVVSFLTGTSLMQDHINWPALAAASPVLVIYMGLSQMHHIANQLLAAGRHPHETVVFVSNATTSAQHVLHADLATAGALAQQVPSPALTIIGVNPNDIDLLTKTIFQDMAASFA